MDRPRRRRPDPHRTGPIRNAGEILRDGESRRGSSWPEDNAASRGVREGYSVIDEQIRRGHRMAQAMCEEDRYGGPSHRNRSWRFRYPEENRGHERRGSDNFLEMPMRHIEILAREILHQIGSARPAPWRLAELIFRLQLEAISELARLGFSPLGGYHPDHYHDDSYQHGYHHGHHHHHHDDDHDGHDWDDPLYDDVARVGCSIDETYDEIQDEICKEKEYERWPWPAAPSTPTTIRSTVPIPVYVSSHERTEIDVDLPAGAQSLDLEVEPSVVAGPDLPVLPEPAFEADFVTFGDGPAILRIEVPRDLPAGRYLRRVLVRATGEPVGELTVQVGVVPVVTAPPVATAAKKGKKR